jgi:hypothetical protein
LTKWRTAWGERLRGTRLELIEIEAADQRQVLDAGVVDVCFVRLPIEETDLHLIRLYEEAPVAWVSKKHPVAVFDEVSLAELADETVLTDATAASLDLAAVGEAVLHVPQSIARTHSRRDFVYRSITDAPTTTVALAWLVSNQNELIEEFIGIVRGRTANSSRTTQARAAKPAEKSAKSDKSASRQQPPRRPGQRGPRRRG